MLVNIVIKHLLRVFLIGHRVLCKMIGADCILVFFILHAYLAFLLVQGTPISYWSLMAFFIISVVRVLCKLSLISCHSHCGDG